MNLQIRLSFIIFLSSLTGACSGCRTLVWSHWHDERLLFWQVSSFALLYQNYNAVVVNSDPIFPTISAILYGLTLNVYEFFTPTALIGSQLNCLFLVQVCELVCIPFKQFPVQVVLGWLAGVSATWPQPSKGQVHHWGLAEGHEVCKHQHQLDKFYTEQIDF